MAIVLQLLRFFLVFGHASKIDQNQLLEVQRAPELCPDAAIGQQAAKGAQDGLQEGSKMALGLQEGSKRALGTSFGALEIRV